MLGVAAVIPVIRIIIGNRNFDEMFILKDILHFFKFQFRSNIFVIISYVFNFIFIYF